MKNQTNQNQPLILVVDDTPENLQVFGGLLSREPYNLAFATNGKQALSTAKKALPDMILLDIFMPGMDGYEVCLRLKENQRTRDIPVIFVTAKMTDPEDIVKGFEFGAVDYVTKPLNSAELLHRVRLHLELKQLRDHLEAEVAERTAELQEKNKQLEELNTTLNTLISRREQDHRVLEESIMTNIRNLIVPLLRQLKKTPLDDRQRQWLDMIETYLTNLSARFIRKLSVNYHDLTPGEIRVARLIRDGKSTKQIAKVLNVSNSVVGFHRHNIRKKLGLLHKKVNLASYLDSLE